MARHIVLTVWTVVVILISAVTFASAQTEGPEAVVAGLYRYCGATKQITDLNAAELGQFFLPGTVQSILEDGSNLKLAKFDALYVTPNARIAGLTIGKAQHMTLLKQDTAFV